MTLDTPSSATRVRSHGTARRQYHCHERDTSTP